VKVMRASVPSILSTKRCEFIACHDYKSCAPRERDLRDARVGYAVLTRTGERVVKESGRSAEAISEDLLAREKMADLEQLSTVLKRLAR
jgi:DNA-binding MarR family transcriptional regulator